MISLFSAANAMGKSREQHCFPFLSVSSFHISPDLIWCLWEEGKKETERGEADEPACV